MAVAWLRFCVISISARSFCSGLTFNRVVSIPLVRSIFHITVLLWPTLASDSSSTSNGSAPIVAGASPSSGASR